MLDFLSASRLGEPLRERSEDYAEASGGRRLYAAGSKKQSPGSGFIM